MRSLFIRTFILSSCFTIALQLCATPLSLTLTPSDHNGYNISCNSGNDGAIDLTITGGTPPYTILWTNGLTSEDIGGLSAGYYGVGVVDALGARETAELTLTEPSVINYYVDVPKYPNGYQVSCYECYNASAEVLSLSGGVPPYTYSWYDGPTTATRSGLGAGGYTVMVTDHNGCNSGAYLTIEQPDRNDWTMTGNEGTDPNTHFIGTTDDKDVVFRANGYERLRLRAGGGVLVPHLAGASDDLVYVDASGQLKRGPGGGSPAASVIPWYQGGNNGVSSALNRIGPMNNVDFILLSNATERLRIKNNGLVGIGTNAPETALHLHSAAGAKLLVSATTGDATTWARNDQGAYGLGVDAAGKGKLFNDFGTPAATMTFDGGKVAVGAVTPTDQFEVHTALARGGLTLVNDRLDVNAHSEIRFKKGNTQRWALGCDFEADGSQDFFLWNQANESLAWRVDADGRMGIGDVDLGTSALYRLYVEGGIVARDVLVQTGAFPDYVFAPGYRLMPLEELRTHLARWHHLPGIPSAAEVEAAQGVEVGDLQVRMLKVIEEQALYILEQEERLRGLEERIEQLEQR